MKRTLPGLAVVLFAAHAAATSHFVASAGRPVGVTVAGTFRLFTLAGAGQSTISLVSKTATGDWVAAPNSQATTFYMTAGVVSTGVGVFGGGPRLYLVSSTPTANLWEYDPASSAWRSVTGTNPMRPSFANLPAIAASRDAWGNVIVAVRSFDAHIWVCTLASSTVPCTWTDGTAGYPVDPYSPVGLLGTNLYTYDTDVYTIAGTGGPFFAGSLQRWRARTGVHDNIGLPNGTNTIVDHVSIQPINLPGGITDVAVATWDQSPSTFDTLQLAQSTQTNNWAWYTLSQPSTIGYAMNNIAWGTDGASYTIWVEDSNQTNLWSCDPSGTNWVWHSRPSDASGLGGAMWGDLNHAYVTGSVGGAEYIYDFNSTTDAWENHLTYRDQTMQLPNHDGNGPVLNLGEYVADEFHGTIAVSAMHLSYATATPRVVFWLSTDDGSTFTGPTFPFEGVSIPGCSGNCIDGDESVAFDANGDLYLTVMSSGLATQTMYVRRMHAGNWGPVASVAQTPVPDHPTTVADRTRPGTLYVAFANAITNFAYCNGSSDCSNTSVSWCPTTGVYTLPSRSHCKVTAGPGGQQSQTNGGSGCELAQGGDGQLWVAISDDSGCGAGGVPSGYPPFCDGTSCDYRFPRTRAIGVRKLTPNLTPGQCSPAGQAPVSATPDCIYYVEPGLGQMNPSATDYYSKTNGPGMYRHWSTVLSAARDGSGVISLALESARDIYSGQPCTWSSTRCRMEVYFATRNSSTSGWCGAQCQATGPWNLSNLLVVNLDGYYGTWVDHLRGSPVLLDNQHVLMSWLDWRDDWNDVGYAFRTASMMVGSLYASEIETPAWPSTNAGAFSLSGGNWFGDVDLQANARLHGHFFSELSPPSSTTVVPVASIQSPFAMFGQ